MIRFSTALKLRKTATAVALAPVCILGGLLGGTIIATVNITSALRAKGATQDETRRRVLAERVTAILAARRGAEMLISVAEEREYQARRELEEMGYYPCRKCGVPHVDPDDEESCLPKGAYYSADLGRYVHVGHPNWSRSEYETWSGQAWDEEPEEEELH